MLIILRRLDNFTGLQTAGANTHSVDCSPDQCAHPLKIWLEPALGSVVCVAHAISKLRALATYFTSLRHCGNLLDSSDHET